MAQAAYKLGIIAGNLTSRDSQSRLVTNCAFGRLVDAVRELVPGTRLCVPILPEPAANMNHVLGFPPDDIVALPPLKSTLKSQAYYFQTRRILKEFVKSVDYLYVRLPFQIPSLLRGLGKPKLIQCVGNVHRVVSVSHDYRGLMHWLAVRFAQHSINSSKRMVAEPATRTVTHGQEMWDLLGCRDGRKVVSSCLRRDEIRPRADLRLSNPPRLLFVGYLRPEKGAFVLLDAFEQVRRERDLRLTVVGGCDTATVTESRIVERLEHSPFRKDIELAGLLDFGPALFDMYRSHDIYILPSFSEGTPRTLVEARAFGCPVIATRVGGIPSSVNDGRDGLLVEPNDPAGLAAAIRRVLDDEPLRLSLIQEGLRRVNEWTVEHFAGELVEELDLLVASTNGAPRDS